MIKVLFFGQLKDRLQSAGINMHSEASQSVAALLQKIIEDQPQWAQDLQNERLLVAVDQVMAQPESLVSPTAEVAFFPPVTGG
jgi:molybdopterin synthase sulfur carrier subunit